MLKRILISITTVLLVASGSGQSVMAEAGAADKKIVIIGATCRARPVANWFGRAVRVLREAMRAR